MADPKLVELHPNLFIRGHTLGLRDKKGFARQLRSRGVRLILNVALRPDDRMEEAASVYGIEYIHSPLSDSRREPPTLVLLALVERVTQVLSTGGSVLSHCDSGWNRSALIALPALSRHSGKDIDEVIAEARGQRSKVLKNRTFERIVREVLSKC